MNPLALLAAGGLGVGVVTYVDDVFSAFLYAGTGASKAITNGVDLAGQGGMVWIKDRDITRSHKLHDTVRGGTKTLSSESTAAEATSSAGTISAFGSAGFTLSADGVGNSNVSGENYVAWSFRKAAKFFDVVTWTGTGANRTITHNLGSVPGMIFVKRTDTTGDWQVYHRSLANTDYAVLNTTAASATGATRWNSTTATSGVFSIGTDSTVNATGGAYVAYVFGHDTSATGLIQCGTFTTDGSGNATVALGWEPQLVKLKASSATGNWIMVDAARGMPVGSNDQQLYANATTTETVAATISPTATGFDATGLTASTTYIYTAIRRPNKPPTAGTQVFNTIVRTGTGAAASVTGVAFPPDLVTARAKSTTGFSYTQDRLRGQKYLSFGSTSTEGVGTQTIVSFDQDGFTVGTDPDFNGSGNSTVHHCFKRAPGFFDEVCYTGDGIAGRAISHGLGAIPELIIAKPRSTARNWATYFASLGYTQWIPLNLTNAAITDANKWYATPTSSVFYAGTDTSVNESGTTQVAYLFATLAGISKVGSYTGNGTNQTIACGFAAGARFILIKRTDSASDWLVWDSTRGIVAGNDPHHALNLSTADVTSDDSIDPATSGFIVNQLAATNINVTSASYVFFAVA